MFLRPRGAATRYRPYPTTMKVRKRDGSLEDVAFEKISRRLDALWVGGSPSVDVSRVAAQVCASIHDGVSTSQLDEYAADVAVALATEHPGYGELASRILVSNLHKNTLDDAVETWSSKMHDLLSPSFLENAAILRPVLAQAIDYASDDVFDYFGFRTLERLYLTRVAGAVVERPQHMFARVAVALWGDEAATAWAAGEPDTHPAIERLLRTYALLAAKYFTHASPTLFNAGMRTQQLSSCFLLGVEDDSIEGIFDAMRKVALISKHGGGVGLHVQGVRSKGSAILGTNGKSDGLVPMLRCFNSIAEYVNQGGRRKGSVAVYIEPHHPDIMEVLDLKRNAGEEHMRARDLFYAVWLSDIFMRRVEADGAWSTFDPKACPGLENVWGPAYDELYARYEAEGRAAQTLKARDVFFGILRAQIETGEFFWGLWGLGFGLQVAHDSSSARRHAVHPVQGLGQREEQPAEPGDHQVLQPVHRDHRVHLQGRGGRVQPRVHQPAGVRQGVRIRFRGPGRRRRDGHQEPGPRDRHHVLPHPRGRGV